MPDGDNEREAPGTKIAQVRVRCAVVALLARPSVQFWPVRPICVWSERHEVAFMRIRATRQ